MRAKRHRWGPGLRQRCLDNGCGWWRTPKAGRHGLSSTEMVYARDDILRDPSGERHAPPLSEFAAYARTPACEGEVL